MKNFFFFLFLFFTLTACDIQKRAVKTKTAKDLDEQITTKSKRSGDTVSFKVPKVIFKDTTIYTYNRVGSRIETIYNGNGQIDMVNCITSAIEEIKEENRRLIESTKDKEKEKTESFDSSSILYFMIGLSILVGVALFVMMKMFTDNKKILSELLDRL